MLKATVRAAAEPVAELKSAASGVSMITIEDEPHCELQGEFPSFQDAIAELKRRARIPWDQEPNQAPCTSWKTCGRRYEVVEYDVNHPRCKQLRRVAVLEVSATGVTWSSSFEDDWEKGLGPDPPA
jgi:hypothetical protein